MSSKRVENVREFRKLLQVTIFKDQNQFHSVKTFDNLEDEIKRCPSKNIKIK